MLAPGGKVVKNIAGYDLPKRLTGSFGILGIIAEVTFRLHPVQADSATWTITSDDLDALATVQAQSAAAMSVESLQIRSTEIGFALDVRFASLHEVLQEHEARLHRLCSPLTVRSSTNEVWRERERLFDIGRAAILKITALPSKLNAILQGFHSLTQDVTTACVADATGIITVAITAPPAHAASIIDDLHAQLRAHGGMVVVLRPGSGMPDDIDRWGVSPSAIAVMRAVNISSIRSVCSTSENS